MGDERRESDRQQALHLNGRHAQNRVVTWPWSRGRLQIKPEFKCEYLRTNRLDSPD
jgi:hypothetical protein